MTRRAAFILLFFITFAYAGALLDELNDHAVPTEWSTE